MRSLRIRLLIGAVLGVSVALAAAGVFLVTVFGTHVHRRYIKELNDHLLQLAAAIQIEKGGALTLKHGLSDPAFERPLSGLYWQVSENGRAILRSRSLWDSSLRFGPKVSAPGAFDEREIRGPSNQRLVLVERVVLLQQRPLVLAVAGDRAIVDEARVDFAEVVSVSLLILAALLAAASWFQVGAGLAPLQVLRRQLNSLREGQTDRLGGPHPTELSGLVDDLNRLLAAQAREVERARANAGKLGHGLKTPLAVLGAEARTLRANGDEASATAIENEIETMNARIARTLAAVRAVGPRKIAAANTALMPLLHHLVGVMQRMPRGDMLDWSINGAQAAIRIPIDPRDLEDLFGNLLDNARKWANNRVDVILSNDREAVDVVIEDDGPGIPQENIRDVLEDGLRLDRTVPGTGIGLAIAQDLIELHGGGFTLGKSDLGGVRAAVRLPWKEMPTAQK